MRGTGEEAAFGGAPELTMITAITTATAATTLPVITQTSARPRRIGPPRPSCLSLGNLASSRRQWPGQAGGPGDGGGPDSTRLPSHGCDGGSAYHASDPENA